jgi:hypothetical protein
LDQQPDHPHRYSKEILKTCLNGLDRFRTAGPGVDPKFLGVDDNPAGGQVITYNGWPLYTYVTDAKLGTRSAVATGQGLDLNGGYWYVMLTNGSPVVRPVPPKS